MLIDSEGFGLSTNLADYISYGAWASRGTGVVAGRQQISTGGPLGDNVLDLLTGYFSESADYERVLPSVVSSFFFGCRSCFGPNAGGSGGYYFLDAADVVQFTVLFDSSSAISVYRGDAINGGVLLGSVPAAFSLGGSTYNYYEVGAVVATGIGGSVIVRKDGAAILTISAANTQGSSTAGVGRLRIFCQANAFAHKATHMYFSDATGAAPWNTFLGDVRVQTVLPVSNDAVQFTPNGLTSNHANAANVPPVPATDFNADSTVGDQDTFNCAAIGAGLTTVFAVNVKGVFQKSGAGLRSIQTVLKSGATTGAGASTAIGTSAEQINTMYQTDPNTSAAWTLTNANAAKPGYKISA
jgi:hypothetical protein